jgi:iron complex transport system substrate-binding protein
MQLQRRGFTSGGKTLTGELLERLGARNAAERLGIRGVRALPLEVILKARPDALIMLDADQAAKDQGTALLQHPALMAAYPRERNIVLPKPLTVCGGPAVSQAIQTLARELHRLRPQWSRMRKSEKQDLRFNHPAPNY